MAMTIGRLNAEVGIDPRIAIAGLKTFKDTLASTAKDVVDLQKASENATNQQIKANEKLVSSKALLSAENKRATEAEIALSRAKRAVEKANNSLEMAENRLNAAREKGRETENFEISVANAKITIANATERQTHRQETYNIQVSKTATLSGEVAQIEREEAQVKSQLIIVNAGLAESYTALEAIAGHSNVQMALDEIAANESRIKEAERFEARRLALAERTAFRLAANEAKLIESMTVNLGSASRVINPIGQGWINAAKSMDSYAAKIKHFGTAATFTATAPIGIGLGVAFNDAVKMEQYQKRLLGITHSATEADRQLKIFQKDAMLPGVTFESEVNLVGTMEAISHNFDKSRRTVLEFSNEMARLGATTDQQERAFQALRKGVGDAIFPQREIRQLEHAIPTIRTALKEIYGGAGTSKEINATGDGGAEVIEKLTDYFARSDRAINTTANDLKNFKQEFFYLGAAIGKDVIPVFHEFSNVAIPAVKEVLEWFQALDPSVRTSIIQFALLTAAIGPVSYAVSNLVTVGSGVIKLGVGIANVLPRVVFAFEAVEAGAAGFGEALLFVTGPIGLVIGGIGLLGGAIYLGVKAYQTLNPNLEAANKQLLAQANITVAHAQQAVDVSALATKYLDLNRAIELTNPNDQKLLDIHNQQQDILKELIKINPDFVSGLDSQFKYQANLNTITDAGNLSLQKRIDLQNELADQARKTASVDADILNSAKSNVTSAFQNVKRDKYYINGKYDPSYVNPDTGRNESQQDYTRERELGLNDFKSWLEKDTAALEAAQANLAKIGEAWNGKYNPWEAELARRASASKINTTPGSIELTGKGLAHAEESAKEWKSQAKQFARDFGLTAISEYRQGAHIAGGDHRESDHAKSIGNVHGLAIDFAGTSEKMSAFFDFMMKNYSSHISQMLYSPRGKVINGKYGDHISDVQTAKDHINHVHLALNSPVEDMGAAFQAGLAFKTEQKEKQKAIRDGNRAARKEESAANKEANKEATEKVNALNAIRDKQIDLYFALGKTNDMTGAQSLALEFATENYKKYGSSAKTPLDILQRQNLALKEQKNLDLHNLFLGGEAKIKDQNNDNYLTSKTSGVAEMIKNFGVEDWRKLTAIAEKGGAAGKKAAAILREYELNFIDVAAKGKNATVFSDLAEMQSRLENVVNRNSGDKSEFSKTQIKLKDVFKDFQAGGTVNESLTNMIKLHSEGTKLLNMAEQADRLKGIDSFNKIFDPLDKSGRANSAYSAGTYNEKQQAFSDWLAGNRDTLEQLAQFSDSIGYDFVEMAKTDWLRDWDISKKVEGLKNFNTQMNEAVIQAQVLSANTPFAKWLSGQEKTGPDGNILDPNFGGKDPQDIFKALQNNGVTQKMQDLNIETAKLIAETSAKNPFDAWLVTLEQFNQATGKMELPEGFDRSILKSHYELQQNLQMVHSFADGMKTIFGKMFTDLRDHGFKGFFSEIEHGFEDLLFRMAVEYLESYFYQMIMGSLGGVFGKSKAGNAITSGGGFGGASGMAGGFPAHNAIGGRVTGPSIVGEHGKELFIPGTKGYIVNNTQLNNMGISAGAMLGYYSGGNIGNPNANGSRGMGPGNTTNSSQKIEYHEHNHYNYSYSGNDHEGAKRAESAFYQDAHARSNRINHRLGGRR